MTAFLCTVEPLIHMPPANGGGRSQPHAHAVADVFSDAQARGDGVTFRGQSAGKRRRTLIANMVGRLLTRQRLNCPSRRGVAQAPDVSSATWGVAETVLCVPETALKTAL